MSYQYLDIPISTESMCSALGIPWDNSYITITKEDMVEEGHPIDFFGRHLYQSQNYLGISKWTCKGCGKTEDKPNTKEWKIKQYHTECRPFSDAAKMGGAAMKKIMLNPDRNPNNIKASCVTCRMTTTIAHLSRKRHGCWNK